MSKKQKRILTIVLLIFVPLGVTTVGVGTYFVNYALTPNEIAKNRNPVATERPEGVAEEEEAVTTKVAETQALEDNLAIEWEEAVEPLTREVAVESKDGLTLRGHQFLQEEATPYWAVVVHGYQMNEQWMYPVARHYYEAGYNVLTYDQRSLGESEGNYMTMGIKEAEDLVQWLQLIIDQNPDAQIVTHGQSMGAGTVMMSSGLDDFPEQVIAVVEDSGYSSAWDVFESELYQRFQLPAFPILHMAGLVAIFQADINIFNEGYTTEMIANSTTPTLFIHGTADDFVPYPMVYELYDAHPTEDKDILVVEGAGHSDSKYLEPDLYWNTVFNFIDQYKE